MTSVLPQGLAAQAGICQSDILLTLDDVPLVKTEDLEDRLKAAGDKALKLELLHRGQKKTVQIQPRSRSPSGRCSPHPPEFWIGVSVTPVTPALRAQLQIPADQGLMVSGIIDDGPAAKAGFKVNDIFLSINGKHVSDQADLVKLVQTTEKNRWPSRSSGKARGARSRSRPNGGRVPTLPQPNCGTLATGTSYVLGPSCRANSGASPPHPILRGRILRTRILLIQLGQFLHRQMPVRLPIVWIPWPPRSRSCARPWTS